MRIGKLRKPIRIWKILTEVKIVKLDEIMCEHRPIKNNINRNRHFQNHFQEKLWFPDSEIFTICMSKIIKCGRILNVEKPFKTTKPKMYEKVGPLNTLYRETQTAEIFYVR